MRCARYQALLALLLKKAAEREKERERERVCVCVCERQRGGEGESERARVREREITYIGIFSEISSAVSAPAEEGS